MLLDADDGIGLSVSATTRPIRPGEIDGMSIIISSATRSSTAWSPPASSSNGPMSSAIATARSNREVLKQIESGRDVLLDIDWQGTQQLKQVDPDIVRVFILPPSMEELERRLRERGTDSDEVIANRMARSAAEISHWAEYDYVLINDDAEHCRKLVHTILKAERLKAARRVFLHDFVRGLIG